MVAHIWRGRAMCGIIVRILRRLFQRVWDTPAAAAAGAPALLGVCGRRVVERRCPSRRRYACASAATLPDAGTVLLVALIDRERVACGSIELAYHRLFELACDAPASAPPVAPPQLSAYERVAERRVDERLVDLRRERTFGPVGARSADTLPVAV